MLIRNTDGDSLRLTKTELRQLGADGEGGCVLKLKDLKTAKTRVLVKFTKALDEDEKRPFPVKLSRAKRTIGCCAFDKETFAKILAAAAETK